MLSLYTINGMRAVYLPGYAPAGLAGGAGSRFLASPCARAWQAGPGGPAGAYPGAGSPQRGRGFLPMHEPFSLLAPVSDGDRPAYLSRSLRSAVKDQTVRPDQVIIVRDGPVGDELARCLDDFVAASPVPVTLVPLPHNVGLGPAL